MKKNLLLVLILCVILALGACGARAVIETAAGSFEVSQATMDEIKDDNGNGFAASSGNTLLVIYLIPVDANTVTEDDAYNYFYSGTKAQVDGQVYDMKCISLEKVGGRVRYGLVFDIVNNNYSDKNKPDATLQLPNTMPQITPEPTATPLPTPVITATPTPIPSASSEASPTASAS